MSKLFIRYTEVRNTNPAISSQDKTAALSVTGGVAVQETIHVGGVLHAESGIDCHGNKIVGVSVPTGPDDVVTRGYLENNVDEFSVEIDPSSGKYRLASSGLGPAFAGGSGAPVSLVLEADSLHIDSADNKLKVQRDLSLNRLTLASTRNAGLAWQFASCISSVPEPDNVEQLDLLAPSGSPSLTFRGSDGSATFYGKSRFLYGLSAGGAQITDIATPVLDTDACTKGYTDSVAQGLDLKDSVVAASITAGSLTTSFVAGSQLDGVTLLAGQRILLKDQTDSKENGIYIVAANGAPKRAVDMKVNMKVNGAYTFVEGGTLNKGNGYCVTSSAGADVVGVNTLNFTQFSGAGMIITGNALSKNGNRLDVVIDNVSLQFTPGSTGLRIASGAISTGLSGGSGTPISVNSNLSHVIGLGTVTSGIWNASTVTVPFGGTGAVSLPADTFLLGSGTSPISAIADVTYDRPSSTMRVVNISSSSSGSSSSPIFAIGTSQAAPQAGVLSWAINAGSHFTNTVVNDLVLRSVGNLRIGSASVAGSVASSLDILSDGTIIGVRSDESASLATGSVRLNGGLAVSKSVNVGYSFTVGWTGMSNGVIAAMRGSLMDIKSNTFVNTGTVASATSADYSTVRIGQTTLAASATGVKTTNAASLYIAGPPIAGANTTVTNGTAITVASGAVIINDVSTAIDKTSGALVVKGGVGISGDLFTGGAVVLSGGYLAVGGYATVGGTFSVLGATTISNTLAVNSSGTGSVSSATFFQASMATGSNNTLLIGQSGSAMNSGSLGFYYAGGAGSATNYMKLQVSNQPSGLLVRGDGTVLSDAGLVVGNSQNVGTITLGNQANASLVGGVMQSDPAHAIYLRYNKAGTVNKLAQYSSGDIEFYTNGLIAAQTLKMSIAASGNVSIPAGSLTVAGGATISGAVNIQATSGLTMSNAVASSNQPILSINGGGGTGNAVGLNLSPFSGRSGGVPVKFLAVDAGTADAYATLQVATGDATTAATEILRAYQTYVNIPSTLPSTSPAFGAFRVAGGVGIGGNINVGGYAMIGTSGGASSTVPNMLGFSGVSGDSSSLAAMNTAIVERIYGGTESSELLIFKGNDVAGTAGPDVIRIAAAEFYFDALSAAGSYNYTSNTLPTLVRKFAITLTSSTFNTPLFITDATNVGSAINSTSATGGALNVVGDVVLGVGGEVYFSTGASAVGPPTASTRAVGSKLVLYPSIGSLQLDYAVGIENGAMWHSILDGTASYKWYAGATATGPVNIMTLSGAGNLTLNSALNQPLSSYIRNTNSGTSAYSAIVLGNDTGANALLFLNSSTRASDGPTNSAILRNDAGDLYLLAKAGSANVSGIRVAATTGAVSIPVSLTVGNNTANPALTVSAQGIAMTVVNSTSTTSQTSITLQNSLNGTTGYLGLDGSGLQAFNQDALTLYVNNGKPIQLLSSARIETNAPIVMTNTTLYAAPTFNTRSSGTKLVLYGGGVSASAVEYALGIEGGTLWSSVPTTAGAFKWYAGTTNVASLGGDAHGIRQASADGAIITKGWEPFTSGKYYSASFPVSSYGLFMEPSAITIGGRNLIGKMFQVVGYNLDSTLVQRLSVDLSTGATSVSGTLSVTSAGTGYVTSASFMQPSLATGFGNSLTIGQSATSMNAGQLSFSNVGTGSASNYLKLQIANQQSGLIIRGDGAVLTDASLTVGSSQNVGTITLGNQSTLNGGIISSDPAHAIYLRYNYAGTMNTVAHYSYGDIQFYTNGLIGAQSLKLSIAASGNVTIPAGSLTVAGGATISSSLQVSGGASIAGTLNVAGPVLNFNTSDNSCLAFDAAGLSRFGFVKQAGFAPKIVTATGANIVMGYSNQSNLTTNVAGSTITDVMTIGSGGVNITSSLAVTGTISGPTVSSLNSTLVAYEDGSQQTLNSGSLTGSAIYQPPGTTGQIRLSMGTSSIGQLSWQANPGNAWSCDFEMYQDNGNDGTFLGVYQTSATSNIYTNAGGYAVAFNRYRNAVLLALPSATNIDVGAANVITVSSTLSAVIPANTWVSITVKFQAGSVSIFCNGSQIGGTSKTLPDAAAINRQGTFVSFAGYSNTVGVGMYVRNIRMVRGAAEWELIPGTNSDIRYRGSVTLGSISVAATVNPTATGGALNSSGDIVLGGTSPKMFFNSSGVAPPSKGSRSLGTRLVLYSSLTAASTEYALGIEGSTLWYSVPATACFHKWYSNDNNIMTLFGDGNLSLFNSVDRPLAMQVRNTSPGISSYSAMQLFNDTGASLAMFLNSSTRTSDGPANSAIIRNDAGDLYLAAKGTGTAGISIAATTAAVTIPGFTRVGSIFSAPSPSANLIVNSGVTNGGTGSLAAPVPVLVIGRDGIAGQTYSNAVSFNVSRYTQDSSRPKTQVDIVVGDATFSDVPDTTLMSLLATGIKIPIDAEANSVADGALRVTGGVGIGKSLFVGNEIVSYMNSGFGQFRAVCGNYGVFFRNDGNDFSLLATPSGSPLGLWSDSRPLRYSMAGNSMYSNSPWSFTDSSANALKVTGGIAVGQSITTAGGLTFTGDTPVIQGTGSTGPLNIDPNFSTESYVRIYDRLSIAGTFDVSGDSNIAAALTVGGSTTLNGELYSGANAWIRKRGSNGIYWEDYGGGWNMTDSAYMRCYGDKAIYTGGLVQSGSLLVGGSATISGTLTVPSTAVVSTVKGDDATQVQWPPGSARLTAQSTTFSSLPYGNGTYQINASSTQPPSWSWYAFAPGVNSKDHWQSGFKYSTGSGAYIGTVSTTDVTTGTSYAGEYVEVQIPQAKFVSQVTLGCSSMATMPVTFVILGSSTTNTAYRALYVQSTAASWSGFSTQTFTLTAPGRCSWIRIVGLSILPGTGGWLALTFSFTSTSPHVSIGNTTTVPVAVNNIEGLLGALNIAGDVVLGATNPRVYFPLSGQDVPKFAQRSAGSKIIMWPNIGPATTDFAIGMETNYQWSSVPSNAAGQGWKWYAGTSNVMSLDAIGNLSTINVTGNQSLTMSVQNRNAGASAYAGFSITNDTNSGMIMFVNSSTRTTDGPANSAVIRNDAGDLYLSAKGSGTTGVRITQTSGVVTISNTTDAGSTTDASAAFRVAGGAGIAKTLHVGNEIVSYMTSGSGQFRAVSGNYGVLFRNDGNFFYLLATPSGSPLGGWTGSRPFTYNIAANSVTSDAPWTFSNSVVTSGSLGSNGNLYGGAGSTGPVLLLSFTYNDIGSGAQLAILEPGNPGYPNNGAAGSMFHAGASPVGHPDESVTWTRVRFIFRAVCLNGGYGYSNIQFQIKQQNFNYGAFNAGAQFGGNDTGQQRGYVTYMSPWISGFDAAQFWIYVVSAPTTVRIGPTYMQFAY